MNTYPAEIFGYVMTFLVGGLMAAATIGSLYASF